MSVILSEVMVSQVFAHVITNSTANFKYMQFIVHQLYLNKANFLKFIPIL